MRIVSGEFLSLLRAASFSWSPRIRSSSGWHLGLGTALAFPPEVAHTVGQPAMAATDDDPYEVDPKGWPARGDITAPSCGCGKRLFPSEKAARTAHAKAHYRIRTYRCPGGRGYHATNQEKRHRQGEGD